MRGYFLLLALITSNVLGSNQDLTTTTTQKRSLGYLLYNIDSTTPLGPNEEYNSGPIDVAEFSMISVIITGTPAHAAGDLCLEFSPDSINWDRTIHIPVEDLKNEPPHTVLPVSVFFRIRYVNRSVAQSSMRLQAVFHRNAAKGLTSRLEQKINSSTDVDNVRAVSVGKSPDGTYTNTKQDGSAFRTTDNLAGTTLSGELVSGTTGTQALFTDVSNFPANGYIYIDSEFIGYSANNLTNTLTITERGAFGTTDATHTLGSTVGEAYTSGILTLDGYTEVATKILCSNTGQMRFQWYSDPAGINNIRTIAPPYSTTALYDFLAAPNFGPYVRYTFANTQPFDTTKFFFETEFYTKSISAQVLTLDSTIINGMTSNLTRAIIAGRNEAGKYKNVRITSEDALSVDVKGAASAFGEVGIAEATTISQIQFTYGFDATLMKKHEHNGATVSSENSMIKLSTGTGQNSHAEALSLTPIKYNAGQGSFCRFSGIFSPGVEGSNQLIGVGDSSNGFFFGYKSTQFGVLIRQGGIHEVRTLTINKQSKNNQNITITLDGDEKIISVSEVNDITETANEIAAADYSNTGSGWSAKALGNKVIFTAQDSSPRNGTYAFTATENPENGRPEGSFAQTIAGKAPNENFTPQSNWNIDRYDGTGATGATIDTTKGNVFQIRWQWLGFGAISFFIENPSTGSIERVHIEQYANKHLSPSVHDPNLRLHYSVENNTNTSNITLFSGSIAGFVDGRDLPFGRRGATRGDKTVRNIEQPILTLYNSTLQNDKTNLTLALIRTISCGSNHSQPIEISFYQDASLVGSSFSALGAPFSFLEKDTSATAVSGGTYLGSIYLQPRGTNILSFGGNKDGGVLLPGSSITLTAKSIGSNKNGKVYGNIHFLELK